MGVNISHFTFVHVIASSLFSYWSILHNNIIKGGECRPNLRRLLIVYATQARRGMMMSEKNSFAAQFTMCTVAVWLAGCASLFSRPLTILPLWLSWYLRLVHQSTNRKSTSTKITYATGDKYYSIWHSEESWKSSYYVVNDSIQGH